MTSPRTRSIVATRPQARAAVLAILGCGMALTLLQRGLQVAMSGEWSKLGAFFVFDASMWVLWLVLSPAVVRAARRWPFQHSLIANLIAHLTVATVLSAA